MTTASFEGRLTTQGTPPEVTRLIWVSVALVVLLSIVAKLLESSFEAASNLFNTAVSLVALGGILVLPFVWGRNPKITLADGVLSIHTRQVKQARVTEIRATVGQYLCHPRGSASAGTFWMPLLTLRFPDGKEIMIACFEEAGRTTDRKLARTATYPYLLETESWDRLAALVGAPARSEVFRSPIPAHAGPGRARPL